MKTLYAIVGMRHRGTEKLVSSLPNGEPMLLLREPGNKYDVNAVQVWARAQHVGYIPMKENAHLAQHMDELGRNGADFKLEGKLVAAEWPMVELEEPSS